MSERTYTLPADICDAWAEASISAYGLVATDRALRDAIKAQQPKQRIEWTRGLKVREPDGDVWLLTDEIGKAVLIEGKQVGWLIHRLGGETLDPDNFEVVE